MQLVEKGVDFLQLCSIIFPRWFIQPFEEAFSGPHSYQVRASWESLSTHKVTTLWGAPGSGRKFLAERLLALGSRISAQPTLVLEILKSHTASEVLKSLEMHGSQAMPRILYLRNLDFDEADARLIVSAALELNWHRVLIVSLNPTRHPDEAAAWIGPLDKGEAWALAESILLQKGILPQAVHRRAVDKLGGHLLTVIAGAEAMAALPPSELSTRCESTESLLQLSPRLAELGEAVESTMSTLQPNLQAAARRMGFLGCPFRPGTRVHLIEPLAQGPLNPLIDAGLAVWESDWLTPLPHLIWHTRSQRESRRAEEEEAWIAFAKWCLNFCTEEMLVLLASAEVRSSGRECLAKTWAKSNVWSLRAGLDQNDRNRLLIGSAARCLSAGLLKSAADLLEQVSQNPEGQEGALGLCRGWLNCLEGRFEESIDLLHKGIEESLSAGRNLLASAGLYQLGIAYFDTGRTVTSEFAFRQGAELAAPLKHPIYPDLLSRQAFAVCYQGRYEDALALQLTAVKEWEAFEDAPAAKSLTKLSYARISYYAGNVDQAEADLEAVLPELLAQDLIEDAALSCMILALICVTKSKFSSGLLYGRQSESFAERSGAGLIQTYAMVQQAWCLMGLGRDKEADILIDKIASVILHAKHKIATAVILALLATQASRRGEHQLAMMVLGAAEALWEKAGRSLSEGERTIIAAFLKPSVDNVPPSQARTLKQAGSLIPAEQIVSQLMIDRERLLHPRAGQTSLSGLHQLSPREFEVFNLLAEAKTNKEIADKLGVTEGTVKRQVHSLGVKLKLEGRFQLIQAAKRLRPPLEEGPLTNRRPF